MNKETKLRQKYIRSILKKIKTESAPEFGDGFYWDYSIDIYNDKEILVGFLYPVGLTDFRHTNLLIPLLAKWRAEHIYAFKNRDKISIKKTRDWAENILYENKDKILFIIYDLYMMPIGHIGLAEFDYENKSCEIDNVIRGENDIPGIMTFALTAIINWAKEVLDTYNIKVRVIKNNKHAFKFYEKNSFKYCGENDEFKKMELKGD